MDAVLNWLWQGGLVALAAAALLRATPRCPARMRYCAVWAACIVVLALPCVPFLLSAASSAQIPTTDALATSGVALAMPSEWWTSNTFALGLWSVWAFVCSCQLAVAARTLRRTRKECWQVPRKLEAHWHHWSRLKPTGRRASLMLSSRVRSAAVLGCGSPIIALAPALVEHLRNEDLDRVVVHEWAHVQRRDDIAQYLQFVVRVIAGWHPAIWWLQRQLNIEREVACDEAAVAATGSAKAYAVCLTTIASIPAYSKPFPALAVSSSGLGRRVVRILALRQSGAAPPAHGLVAAAAAMFAILALAVGGVRVVTAAAASTSVGAVVEIAKIPIAGTGMILSAPVIIESPAAHRMTAPRSPAPQERMGPAMDNTGSLPTAPAELAETTTLPAATVGAASPESQAPIDVMAAGPLEPVDAGEAPAGAFITVAAAIAEAAKLQRDSARPRAPWTAAAEAGAAIGRRSQTAGVATAAFFNQFGRKIAGSF
jgi:beta-lactamase regulating signal transducer with metallopeptidase domain